MGKKKQIIGNTIEVEMPPPEKKKREISDKQRENLSKGMAILKAKRESKAKKDDEPAPAPTPTNKDPAPTPAPAPANKDPSPAPAPAPPPTEQPKKERKPRVVKNYLTTEDFNSFKSELLTSLRTNKDPSQERYVAPVMAPSTTTKESTRVISGSELLNKLFFNN